MRTSRNVGVGIALLAVLAMGVVLTPPSVAQAAGIGLRLLAQTPWTTPEKPDLRLEIQASNAGDQPLEDLSIGLALGPAVRARSEYEAILSDGPPSVVFAPTPAPITGTLDPSAQRTLRLEIDVGSAVSSTDSLVYPAEITLFAAGRPEANLITPVLHIVHDPEVPVPFTWWTTVARGPVLDPSGRVKDGRFEASIADGGSLSQAVAALVRLSERQPATSVGVVIEPLLLDQLTEMADGYERVDGTEVAAGTGGAASAEDLLDGLQRAVADPSISLITLPYAAPNLPAMVRSGLVGDLTRQYALGDQLVRDVLGRGGDELVATAPEDRLDDASLSFLADRGATTVLADADTVARPEQPNFFAPPPTATVSLAGGGTMSLVLPDPGTQALLERSDLRADPVRLAQAVLCELAVIWREQPVPVPPTVRGLALFLPQDLPSGAWSPLMQRLAGAPFLASTSAPTLAASVDPVGAPAALAGPSRASFSSEFVGYVRTARREVAAFEQMLVRASDTPLRLLKSIAIAEAGRSVGREAVGRSWLDAVTAVTRAEFERVAPLPDQVFTLTSTTGTILIRMGDPGPEARRVVLELQSSWFRFPDGSTRSTTLESSSQPIPFTVEATANGRRAIRVLVRSSPAGLVIAERNIVVGSTAANRVALFIAGAAAIGLLVLWARRLFPRKTT